jgi:hypothetical protein
MTQQLCRCLTQWIICQLTRALPPLTVLLCLELISPNQLEQDASHFITSSFCLFSICRQANHIGQLAELVTRGDELDPHRAVLFTRLFWPRQPQTRA